MWMLKIQRLFIIFHCIILQRSKDLDVELDDHVSVRDYIAQELTRHIQMAELSMSSPGIHRSDSLMECHQASETSPSQRTHSVEADGGQLKESQSPQQSQSHASLGPTQSHAENTHSPAAEHVQSVADYSPHEQVAVSVAPAASESEPDVAVSGAPKMLKFSAQKKGHVNVGMKPRYFVVHSGILNYYLSQSDSPPYGKDLKGLVTMLSGGVLFCVMLRCVECSTINLANYEIVKTDSSDPSNDLRIYIRNQVWHCLRT